VGNVFAEIEIAAANSTQEQRLDQPHSPPMNGGRNIVRGLADRQASCAENFGRLGPSIRCFGVRHFTN
jgi:hypothetical protein